MESSVLYEIPVFSDGEINRKGYAKAPGYDIVLYRIKGHPPKGSTKNRFMIRKETYPMKKLISAILVLVLALSVTTASLADDPIKFEPTMTKIFDYDVDTWLSTKLNRALITVTLYLDLNLAKEITTDDFGPFNSMVAKVGDHVVIVLVSDKGVLAASYSPTTKTADYQRFASLTHDSAKKVLQENSDAVYENADEDITTVTQIIKEALNSNK